MQQIFSAVNGITSVDLIEQNGNWDNPLSKQMIELKYAVKVEETYVSKMDNETRQTVERQMEFQQEATEQQPETFSRIVNHRKQE